VRAAAAATSRCALNTAASSPGVARTPVCGRSRSTTSRNGRRSSTARRHRTANERVCALAAELRRQQVGEGRREDEPRRQSQIFLHACNVYLQTIHQLHGGVQRAVGEVAELRQHNPLGVPGAGGAFMFLHHRCEQAGGQLLRDGLHTEFEFNIRPAGTDEIVFFDC
jgi:hypothetical protein